MLKSSFIENHYGEMLEIPNSVEDALLSLYSVDKISDINCSLRKSIAEKMKMFSGFENYKNKHREYTLYYFLVNFYKVWRPLLDLYYSGQIQTSVNVLELGVGPGSTTFGLISFYKYLAIENPEQQFSLNLILIEKEKEFIGIFNSIFDFYKKDIPKNLQITYQFENITIDENFSTTIFDINFDLILESNMLNANEYISEQTVDSVLKELSTKLKKQGSIIFIEPADKSLKNYLPQTRKNLTKYCLNIFAPCNCETSCNQLCMAKSFIPKSNIIEDLKKNSIIKNIKDFHYFEYIVLRKDGLLKCILEPNKIQLSQINEHIGEEISFNAFILFSFKKKDSFRIKVCDCSCKDKEIWVTIPISLFYKHKITELEINRGCVIKITKAKIVNSNNIDCENNTRITIRR